MSIFEFISNMTSHLAWPITAVLGLIVFRPVILSLAERAQSISIGGTKFEFIEEVEEFVLEAQKLDITLIGPTEGEENSKQDIMLQIIEDWKEIRQLVNNLQLAALGEDQDGWIFGDPHSEFRHQIDSLYKKRVLDTSLYRALTEFLELKEKSQTLRNPKHIANERTQYGSAVGGIKKRLRNAAAQQETSKAQGNSKASDKTRWLFDEESPSENQKK